MWRPLELKPDSIIMKVEIPDPLELSPKYTDDVLVASITDPSISDEVFFSDVLGTPLHEDYYEMRKNIPRQTLDNNLTKSVENAASSAGTVLQFAFIMNLFTNQILRGAAMNELIKAMTFIFHLPMLRIQWPGLPLTVIKHSLPFILFDYTENPYEVDITSIINFKEYTSE